MSDRKSRVGLRIKRRPDGGMHLQLRAPAYIVAGVYPRVYAYFNMTNPELGADRCAHAYGIAKTPGFAFKDRTGAARASIRRTGRFNMQGGGPEAVHFYFLEYGTKFMRARRTFGRACRRAIREIKQAGTP